ncbi:SDR family NAD(P)-dependent oxidoreductase [Streptomyces abikoensis]|uniref:SDR family NAD(P)-dependent oxidoreductase n=1 Tax=Streptomyces abikoensis TaxID=97398 RepID=UPI00370F9C46
MGNPDGKSAVVTGGSPGIGRAIVQRPASDGATVVFGYATDQRAARATEAGAPHARAVRADVANLFPLDLLLMGTGRCAERIRNMPSGGSPYSAGARWPDLRRAH